METFLNHYYKLCQMSEDIITSLRIDKELWKRAKKYAIDHDMSIREFIEKLIREKLDEKEGGG